MGNKILIWSKKDKGYWKDGGNGYTPYLSHAGLFDRKKSATICPQLNNIIELDDAFTSLQLEVRMKINQ